MADPSIYDLLMGAGPDAAATAQAMAAQIRRGRQAALAGALGSPGAIGQMASLQQANSKQDEALLERAGEARMRSGEEAKAREFQAKQAEQERSAGLRLALAQIAASRPQFHATPGTTAAGYALVDGEWVPTGERDPNAGKGGAGGAGSKPKTYSPGEITALEKANDLLASVKMLEQTFDPKYAGKGLGGDAGLWIKQGLGSSASQKNQDEANYWKQLQLLVTNPMRHALFGSALSAHEKAAWDAANALSPKSSPEVVQKALADLKAVIDNRLTAHGKGRVKEGYSPEATAQYLRDSSFKIDAPDDEQPKKITTKAERDALPAGTRYIGPDGRPYTKR